MLFPEQPGVRKPPRLWARVYRPAGRPQPRRAGETALAVTLPSPREPPSRPQPGACASRSPAPAAAAPRRTGRADPAVPRLPAVPGGAPPWVPAARARGAGPGRPGCAGAEPLPRLEWLRVDDWEDLDFCRLTVIITCSCTRCLPDVPVFIFWSDGKASVELSWSGKHSYAKAVLSGEWFMASGGAGRACERAERGGEGRRAAGGRRASGRRGSAALSGSRGP